MTQDIMWAYGRPRRAKTQARRIRLDLTSDMLVCHECAEPLEACVCVCPYCGDRDGCRCCIGYGLATGGG